MPIILTVDGPSLGGFACPATTTAVDMWKWGQVKPGDQVFFKFATLQEAYVARWEMDQKVQALTAQARDGSDALKARSSARGPTAAAAMQGLLRASTLPPSTRPQALTPCATQMYAALTAPVLEGWPATQSVLQRSAASQWRLAGDRYVFVEFGDMVLDLNVRVMVYEIEKWLMQQGVDGLLEISPAVRSLMVEYDAQRLPLPALLELLQKYACCAHTALRLLHFSS